MLNTYEILLITRDGWRQNRYKVFVAAYSEEDAADILLNGFMETTDQLKDGFPWESIRQMSPPPPEAKRGVLGMSQPQPA